MRSSIRTSTKRFSLTDAIRSRVSTCLYQAYCEDEGLLGDLDRWTQQRVTEENLAKLALVLDSGDPTETCYQDLIREIDAEAETGIYLVRSDSTLRHLRRLIDEPGVSGEMRCEISKIAPIMFADETANSTDDFDAETYKLAVNNYRPMGEQNVLALRAVLRTTVGDDAPFFLLSTFGGSTDLRGYPSGRYRDEWMYALQGEYRCRQ